MYLYSNLLAYFIVYILNKVNEDIGMYQILEDIDKITLAEMVEGYLNEGWKLAGGLAIYTGHDGITFCQAIVIYNNEPLQ